VFEHAVRGHGDELAVSVRHPRDRGVATFARLDSVHQSGAGTHAPLLYLVSRNSELGVTGY
jgi:hypothetical protein